MRRNPRIVFLTILLGTVALACRLREPEGTGPRDIPARATIQAGSLVRELEWDSTSVLIVDGDRHRTPEVLDLLPTDQGVYVERLGGSRCAGRATCDARTPVVRVTTCTVIRRRSRQLGVAPPDWCSQPPRPRCGGPVGRRWELLRRAASTRGDLVAAGRGSIVVMVRRDDWESVRPIESVTVGIPALAPALVGFTDEGGRFVLDSLPEQEQQVQLRAIGYERRHVDITPRIGYVDTLDVGIRAEVIYLECPRPWPETDR